MESRTDSRTESPGSVVAKPQHDGFSATARTLVIEVAMTVDPLDELIDRLNKGDVSAAERAFVAFEPYLRMAVRRRLSGPLRTKYDSMDIVQSIWADVLSGLADAGWRFADRSHFRAFLVRMARNRVIDHHRQHKRAIANEHALETIDPEQSPTTNDPRPSEIAQGHELWKLMLEECSPAHREILILKRQGLLLDEIAARTGMHEGSIRRILYDLARRLAIPRRPDMRSAVSTVKD